MGFLVFIFLMVLPLEALADPVTVVVGAAVSAIGAGSAITAGVLSLGFSWGAFAASLVMSAAGSLFSPKTKSGSSYNSKSGSPQQWRQAVSAREIVYGEIRKGGPVAYMPTTGGNRYQHIIVMLASHRVKKIGEIMIGDVTITDDMMDADGHVISGRYKDYLRIHKYLGTDDQAADPILSAGATEWTTEHRLQGIAYLYIRFKWSPSKFPSGLPQVSAWVQGRDEIYDPRTGLSGFTQNLPLMIRDYLTFWRGCNVAAEFIDDDMASEAANLADEYVGIDAVDYDVLSVDQTKNIITLDGDRLDLQLGDKVRLTSGAITGLSTGTDYFVVPYQRIGKARVQLATSLRNAWDGVVIDLGTGSVGVLSKIAEPRYHGGGIFQCDVARYDNLQEIIKSCAGTLSYIGGTWKIMAGGYRMPTVTLDDGDLAGPMTVTTKVSKRDRCNFVQGIYTTPLNDGNNADYPAVKNSLYIAADGEELKKDFDQAFSQRPGQAQRVAKIVMERSRQDIIFTAPFKLSALKLQVGDVFYFSMPIYGWSAKQFEVTNWQLATDDGRLVVQLTAREIAAAVFDWAGGEETRVDPSPNTSLGNVFDVEPPTGLNVTVEEVATEQGDKTYQFNVGWTPPDDGFVVEGGKFEVEFKESASAYYRPSYTVRGDTSAMRINQVQPGVSYDIRVRSINVLGVASVWTYYVGFTVTSPTGATFTVDYGLFTESPSSTEDDGLFTESPSSTVDDGTFA